MADNQSSALRWPIVVGGRSTGKTQRAVDGAFDLGYSTGYLDGYEDGYKDAAQSALKGIVFGPAWIQGRLAARKARRG